ncbi:MAG: alkaline shock response membrane anchor protein AmaP [Actinobacteria bacterium]|nr:alkaline shock response membrane anchor protein AmaP [Actinomycetota bacterium]
MRIFNKIVVVLLLAGLTALGLCAIVYAFNIAPYRLEDLPQALRLNEFSGGLRGYVEKVENGSLNVLEIATLILIALLGLILLILEFKPPTPRKVRMQRGTYVTRGVVEKEANAAVEQEHEVLQSNVSVKAQRKPGAKVDIRAGIRPGENTRRIQSGVKNRVQQHMGQTGIPVSNLKVRVNESDPRQTETRVK